MEMTTTFPMQFTNDVVMVSWLELSYCLRTCFFLDCFNFFLFQEVVDAAKRKKPKTPSTPPGSPPKSPVEKYTTAAADTTDVRKGLYSPSLLLQGRHLTPEQRKRRETFRMKASWINPIHMSSHPIQSIPFHSIPIHLFPIHLFPIHPFSFHSNPSLSNPSLSNPIHPLPFHSNPIHLIPFQSIQF